MSAWTDARDNFTNGLASIWAAFPPTVRVGLICTGIGFVLGLCAYGLFLC